MKIFFIRPKPGDSPFSTNEKRPPIGIAYLLSILKGIGCDVKFVDMYIGEKCNIMDIVNYNPDFIGMYCDTITFPEAIKTLKLLEYIRHDFNCDFKIMVGGPHATLRPQDFPGFVDYIVQGEGEEAIADIVKGKVKDRIIKYPYIKDLNLSPMPDYKELFKHNYDLTAPEIDARKVMVMNTSRGCPYRCLVGSFKVFTPKGNKLIQQLKSQDKIISWDFRKKSFKTNEILEINKQITKKYLRIIYEHNGKDKVLRVTENHKIHTKRGWINAIDLTENDEILIIECSDKNWNDRSIKNEMV